MKIKVESKSSFKEILVNVRETQLGLVQNFCNSIVILNEIYNYERYKITIYFIIL